MLKKHGPLQARLQTASRSEGIAETGVVKRAVEAERRELTVLITDRLGAVHVHVGVGVQQVFSADRQTDVFSERNAELQVEQYLAAVVT